MPTGATPGVLPVVLTRRGRLVVCVAVTLAAAAVVVALQALAAKSMPTRDGDPAAIGPGASPTGAASSAGERTDGPGTYGTAAGQAAVAGPPNAAATLAAPVEPPATVNGRVQPAPVSVPQAASGELVHVPGTAAPAAGQRVWTYRVEVERGLPFDGAEFAAAVHTTLSDPRGWATRGNAFERLDTETVDFRVILASPALTDRLCAPLRTRGEVSCRNGDLVVLNALRWAEGIEDYGGDLATYREYMVNHEVGHRLGHGHVQCTGGGDPAPVMMQQSYGLDGCRPNPWPLPGE